MNDKPLLCAMVLTSLWIGSAGADPALTVRSAWIPEAPPAARVQAAYMELVNAGATPVVVIGSQSPDFAQVEMHRTVQSKDGARMEPQPELRVEPGATLLLGPGGLHLMLIEPKRRLVAGDQVDIELRLKDGGPAHATAEVRGAAHDHQHHH
jgi:periplasmic copper chaperone A